jgi:hypothetical protein
MHPWLNHCRRQLSEVSEMARYWFPAKRYGWGWGLPVTWQGWAVFAAFFGFLVAGAELFPPKRDLRLYLGYVTLLSAALIAVCWLKGEPPRWRWGDGKPNQHRDEG